MYGFPDSENDTPLIIIKLISTHIALHIHTNESGLADMGSEKPRLRLN